MISEYTQVGQRITQHSYIFILMPAQKFCVFSKSAVSMGLISWDSAWQDSNWSSGHQSWPVNYRKTPKISDSLTFAVIILKFEQCGFTIEWRVQNMYIANSVAPDQTAPLGAVGAVWSGSILFAKICLSENLGTLQYMLCSKTRKIPVLDRHNIKFVGNTIYRSITDKELCVN